MATIVIGGRTLEVRHATLGLLRKQIYPWLERSDATAAKVQAGAAAGLIGADLLTEQLDRTVEGLLIFLDQNPGVDRAFLEEHADPAHLAEVRALGATRSSSEPATGEPSRS